WRWVRRHRRLRCWTAAPTSGTPRSSAGPCSATSWSSPPSSLSCCCGSCTTSTLCSRAS
ncbi:unnamed protein product, partial [Ectocarpus sp. 12 AP-2014]